MLFLAFGPVGLRFDFSTLLEVVRGRQVPGYMQIPCWTFSRARRQDRHGSVERGQLAWSTAAEGYFFDTVDSNMTSADLVDIGRGNQRQRESLGSRFGRMYRACKVLFAAISV